MIFGSARGLSLKNRAVVLTARGVPVLLAACVVLGVCGAAQAQAVTVGDYIRLDLTAAGGRPAGVEDRLQAPDLLMQVYSDRDDIPGWVTGSEPRPIARAMMEALRVSRADGLNPRDYHLETLEQLMAVPYAGLPAAGRVQRLATLELLLSDAFLRLANDEAEGRLNPETRRTSKPPPKLEAALREALQKVFAGAAPGPVIEDFAPQDQGYRGMREALARYRLLAASGEPPPVTAGPALGEGDRGPRVEALVRRLQSAGDMAAGATPDVFDSGVAAALRHYQARHGLRSDAVAGPATLASLNKPAAYWIDKLRVNMERRRELPSVLAPTRLMVNIADFHTTFFMEDKPQLTEKVIVGKSYQKTPEFSSRIGYLVVNPNWDVPSSIARNEILPAAREDSGYFSRHDYQVLEGWGAGEKRVNPNSVDWKSLSAARLPYHFRQLDGPDNPLGRVKFIFSNLHDVYMHDTPARGLFNADRRAFSHGCIRVDNAMRLAAELLRADGRENPGLLLIQAVDEGSNRRIELNRAIPIYIVYMTAWANDLNTIEFRPDVYGRDASVLAGLDTETRSLSE